MTKPFNNMFSSFFVHAPTGVPTIYEPMPAGPIALPIGRMPELVQLARDYDHALLAPNVMIEPKVDGARALYVGGDVGAIFSREGNVLDAAAYSLATLKAIEAEFGRPMVIDGEVAHGRGLDATTASLKSRRPDPTMTFWMFDALPLDAWTQGFFEAPQTVRTGALAEMMRRVRTCSSVGMVRSALVSGNDAQVRAIAHELWEAGHEGIVIKDAAAGYERNRNRAWMKLKRTDRTVVRYDGTGGCKAGSIALLTDEDVGFQIALPKLDVPIAAQMLAGEHLKVSIEVIHHGWTSRGVPREARFGRFMSTGLGRMR